MIHPEDDLSTLEEARARLYKPGAAVPDPREPLAGRGERSLRHEWEEPADLAQYSQKGERHVRLAGMFFVGAFVFFLIALSGAGYLFYFEGNSVSVDKIAVSIQGPTTIAGGDTVPLSLTITNQNPVAIENAKLEVDFPEGSRNPSNVLSPYPRYTEDLGTLPAGATITRSVKAVVFGEAGQTALLPVSISYNTSGSNAVFEKKTSYVLAISSTPLSISVDTLSETVAGQPLTLNLTVRSNASVPLANVILTGTFPFGFSVTASSLPSTNGSFSLGTLAPGATKTVRLTGTLSGQQNDEKIFRFTVGTAVSERDPTLSVKYMTQDAAVKLSAPFIATSVSVNGDTSPTPIITPKEFQSVTVSYANTLATSITDAVIAVTITGGAVDYGSIRTTNGFYRSGDHTIVFSKDTDPALVSLAPGAAGIGTFTFTTLPPGALPPAPTITFAISVSGTRVGQTNVPEAVSSLVTKSVKVATVVALSSSSRHSSGPFETSGPIPPRADQATTYSIIWDIANYGNAVAGGKVSAVLPGYVSYVGKTAGNGSFAYNESSRTVTWSTGDLAQGGRAQGAFLVSLVPSSSQRGSAPQLTGAPSFSGYDRFAGTQVSANAAPVTTETVADPGYTSDNAVVQ
ncbi:hypothetical protein HYV30_00020 [Candidatus Kaiserbacteria bacterium]|nr:hypothetical protein [Candidatus Kaiserbacteria bacterium]